MTDRHTLPDIEHAVYIDASPQRVYETLTTGDGWDRWFTDGTEVNAAPGGHIRLRWRDFGAEHWTTEDGGLVLEAVPGERFVFQWNPGERPTTVAFTLEPLGPGTLVKLTESGYSASDRDAQTYVGCAVGWGEALTLLKFYLEHGFTYGQVPSLGQENPTPMNIHGVTALLQVFDMRRSVAFYRDVLGFTVVSTYEPEGHFYWAELKLGDATLMLNAAHEDDVRPSSPDPARVAAHADTILYFECDSVDNAYAHLCAVGWETRAPTTTHYGMRQVYTKDPDGYELCFQHPAEQPAETVTS